MDTSTKEEEVTFPTQQELKSVAIPVLAKRYGLSPSYLYRLKKGAYQRKTPLPDTTPRDIMSP